MKYFANKPCKFAGNNYLIGDVIPAEVLVPSRIESLKKAGIISESPATIVAGEVFEQVIDDLKGSLLRVPVYGDGNEVHCFLCTEFEINAIFTILQKTIEEATEIIASEKSENVLNIIKNIDSRKGIKVAASSRITELELNSKSDEKIEDKKIKGDA